MKKSRKSPHVRTTYSNVKSNETFNCNTNPSASTSKSLNITTKKRSQVNESTVLVIKPKEKSNNFPKSSSRLIVDTTPDPTEECEDEHRSTSNVPVTNLPTSNTNNNWLRELSRKKMLPEALHQSELPVVPTKVSKMSGDCNKIVHHLEEELTVLKDVNIREENYQIPNKSLREVFEYLGHKYEIRNGVPITSNSTSIQAKCLICLKVYSYQSPSTGGVSNLIRHLKKYHPDKGAELEKKEAASEEKSRDIMHSWFRSKQKSKYHPSDHQQTKFNKALLYCIAKDKLPMSLGNGKGFSNLMSTIDPKLSIPSRSTVQRRFKQEHEKNVIPSLKQVLKSMGKGIISLDSWKSRRKDGILAFKFHCIDNSWSVRNLTLGIREINESQTGDTIRKHFDDLIDELNIRDKVAMVMTDSGANMVKAFKAPISKTAIEEHFDSESDDEIQVDDEVPDDEIIIYCESENENDEDSNEFTANSDTDSFSAFQPLLGNDLQHLRCTSHQLQLGINSALETEEAAAFLSYMNKIINFFSNNTVFLAKLRKLAGKGLLKRAQTRWNYWVDAINRLTEEKVYLAVETLLKLAHQTFKLKQKEGLPRKLQNSDKKKMKEFSSVLRPFADLTDVLQADGVTSSILINSLVCKLKEVKLLEVKYFLEMRNNLVAQIIKRFEPIVNHRSFILATAVDARMKLNVFKLKGLRLPSYTDTKKMCKEFFKEETYDSTNPVPTNQSVQRKCFIDEVNQQAQNDALITGDSIRESEFDLFLREPVIPSDSNILEYWKRNEFVYPKLAIAAKLYLAIPASSGSVERLFSELTAIGRAKRACTEAPVFEQLVLHSQHVEEEIKLNM